MADAAIERAYAAAIARVVTPGAIVLDLGGSFAVRAVRACRAGAARVYSVQSAVPIGVARSVLRDNGVDGRVEMIESLPPGAEWLDDVTVVIAEEPAGMPLHGASLTRWRRDGKPPWPPGAATIPRAETLFAAIVHAPDLHARHVRPWELLGARWNLSAARRMAENVWSPCALDAAQLLTDPRPWATVDYGGRAAPRAISAEFEWLIETGRQAHGLAVWSAVDLAGGVAIAGEPGAGVAAMGQAYFPWPTPVALEPGARVTVAFRVEPLSTGWESCLWNWTTTVTGAGRAPAGRRFVQSTFLGTLELPRVAPRPVG